MTTHTGRVFTNSCLKVPIDPCNNCPAPVYNRPKMYLGRLTTTPTTTKLTTATTMTTTPFKGAELETETAMWSTPGVRSLAKFYDSIPDYCDINHLPEEEFYCTLDTLRTTCRQLNTRSAARACSAFEESSNTSSALSQCDKSKKSKSKKTSSKYGKKEKSSRRRTEGHACDPRCPTDTSCSTNYKRQQFDVERLKSLRSVKEDFQEEVEAFKQSLKELEDELKERPRSAVVYKSSTLRCPSTNYRHGSTKPTTNESTKESTPTLKVPARSDTASDMRERLKKSYSLNDIHASTDSPEDCKTQYNPGVTKAQMLFAKDRTKLSNYFMQKSKGSRTKSAQEDVPKIVVEAASPETDAAQLTIARTHGGRKKKSRSKKCYEQIKVPFSLFNLSSTRNDSIESKSSPSPLHPVARPNLAATLRAEVNKKKRIELRNNCTFHDTTPQLDWEVRKTPAWKSLSLNESHKQILSLRLATRKAEQALQKREYELHMELMRQRVKSAPLLLEGTTYWGPSVGKLTHNCPREGMSHTCPNSQRKQRKKLTSQSRECSEYYCGSAGGGGGSGGGGSGGPASGHMLNKINTLRKIYASSVKSPSRSSCQRSTKSHDGNMQRQDGEECRRSQRATETPAGNDSGDDDLSSVDRAFL